MAIIVSDNFTRADNPTSLGTATTGEVWTQSGGTWGILSNQGFFAFHFVTGTGRAVLETGFTHAITSVAIVNPATIPTFAGGAGIICRYVNDNYYFRLVYFRFPGSVNLLRLQRVYAGSAATVKEISITLSANDVLTLAYCGSNFEVLVNGASKGTYDDSSQPHNYGTKSGLYATPGSYFSTYNSLFDNFLVETNDSCGSVSPSATPSASPSASESASPSPPTPCTPPEGSAISCINSKGRLFVTLQNVDNDQIAYAWHEGAERMPITSMTNWKRSLRALTLQELNIAFETDNAGVNDPLVVSIHRNLRKNYARDGRTALGSDRIDSASFGFDTDNIGDMICIMGENVGGPGIDYLIGRIAALGSPGPSPSPSASISPSPSATASASPSLSPSASPSSSRSSSASPSHSPSASPSASPSLSPSPSASPSSSVSASPSASPSAS